MLVNSELMINRYDDAYDELCATTAPPFPKLGAALLISTVSRVTVKKPWKIKGLLQDCQAMFRIVTGSVTLLKVHACATKNPQLWHATHTVSIILKTLKIITSEKIK